MKLFTQQNSTKRVSGFTLIEVMIALSIFLMALYLAPVFSSTFATQNIVWKELQTYEGSFTVVQVWDNKFVEMPNKRMKIDKTDLNVRDIPVWNYYASKGIVHLDNATREAYITIFQ